MLVVLLGATLVALPMRYSSRGKGRWRGVKRFEEV